MRKLIPYTMPDGSRPASRLPIILSAMLAVAVVALLALNVYQYAAGAELQKRVDDLEAQTPAPQMLAPLAAGPNDSAAFKAVDTVLNSYVSSINSTLDQVIFLASYARVISNDGTRFYHRYGCPYCSTDEFVIYSIGNAQKDGYSPCPTCSSPDSAVAKKIQADIDSMCNLLDLIQNGTESSWVRRAASLQPATPDSL